ncbi:hypothetical protein [Pseudonocardia sp. HH130630-07]|uniref:hypothetical protein n=1 Tax=Pseudonocardia sp. HH130630-07 TaxID=1690815 RepID=UPI000814F761|nr:hypothetical protein [Pseudonocardia sp. HH130630-07]ANY05411.1 hypothetical protein AFB00_02775 [Pseudonocardia sp. HH130630-07]
MTAELTRPAAPVPAAPPEPAPIETPAEPHGRTAVHRLLDSLDELVRRHRALVAHDGGSANLHAELIAAELDQQLAVLRAMPRQYRC